MDTDKKEIYEVLYILERISINFINEINKLKEKLHLHEVKPELRKCTYKFYNKILDPLFEKKEKISLNEIINVAHIKKGTIQIYLGELWKYNYINKIKNEKEDRRTKLYEKKI